VRGPGSVNGRRRAASRAAKAEPAQSARAGKEQSALKQEQLRQVIADLHKAREQAKLEKQSALSPMQEAKQEKKKACEAEGRARRKLADPELSTAEAARLREIEKQSQLKQEQLRKVIAELHKAREQEKLEEQSAIQLEQLRQVIADLHKARDQEKQEKLSALSPMQEAKQEKKKACEAEGAARRKLADPELSTAEAERLREIEKQSQLKQEQLRQVIAELHKAREQEKREEFLNRAHTPHQNGNQKVPKP